MHSWRGRLALLLLASVVAVGLVALVWAMGTGSSEAQQGAMQNCPPASKWAISVWSGQDAADVRDALAACGLGAVDFAYYLDPDDRKWRRYFWERQEISNLTSLDDPQAVLTRGAPGASPTPAPPQPGPDPGQVENCPQFGKWALSVWNGPDGTSPGDVFATCTGATVQAAYSLDPQMGAWSRWFADKPEVSNMPPLDNLQGVYAWAGAVEDESCAPVIPGTYSGLVRVGGLPAPDGTVIKAIVDGVEWAATTSSAGQYVLDTPMILPIAEPCFAGGTVTFACDSAPAAETTTWNSGLHDLNLGCGSAPMCGDVNCDDNVDAVDALFILQHVVGLRPELCACPGP